jgi:alpha-glucosidase
VEGGQDLLAFGREPGFLCVVNVGDEPAHLADHLVPDGAVVVLASGPIGADGRVPGATVVWFGRGDDSPGMVTSSDW